MIGLSSGKVVGYNTRTKRCALCEQLREMARNRGHMTVG